MAEIRPRFSGVELSFSSVPYFPKEEIPLLGTSSYKVEVSLLGRINQGGTFPSTLTFEHAVLVNTCDVFEDQCYQVVILCRLAYVEGVV